MVNRGFLFLLMICNISCKNKSADSYLEIARKNLQEKKYHEGMRNAGVVIKMNQDLSEAFLIRGKCLYEMQNFSKAKEDLENFIKTDSSNTAGYYYLGKSYYYLEKDDSAVLCFNKAISIKGRDSLYIEFDNKLLFNDVLMPQLKYSRAIANYQMNHYNDALDDFLFSINNNYNKPDCYWYVGLIALDKGNKEMACQYFNRAAEIGKTDAIKYLKECKN